jgi:uncharacterized membrane protein YfcA
MQIYLPIAEISVNVLLLLGLGGAVGFLSGLFGVGGGFLMTPLLVFIGIPPAVAVGSEANQVVAASVSGMLAHWQRGNVDVTMGLALFAGGFVGSTLGVWLFSFLAGAGQIDVVILVAYVVLLGSVGSLMLIESVVAMRRQRRARSDPPGLRFHQRHFLQALPLKLRFRRSKLYISALLPGTVGAVIGVLSALLGVGGGFLLIPAMIYLLGMPTAVVVGTSLFQIIFVTANVTLLQAFHNQTVDLVLSLLLTVGGVIGAQLGARMSTRLAAEQLRSLMAMVVLAVAIRLALVLFAAPDDPYVLAIHLPR